MRPVKIVEEPDLFPVVMLHIWEQVRVSETSRKIITILLDELVDF